MILMFCFSHALFLHPSPTCLVMAEAWAEMPGAVTQLLAAGGFAVCGPALLGARRASCALFVLATHCKPLSPSELWHSHIHTCISFVLAIWGDFSCFRRFKQTMRCFILKGVIIVCAFSLLSVFLCCSCLLVYKQLCSFFFLLKQVIKSEFLALEHLWILLCSACILYINK